MSHRNVKIQYVMVFFFIRLILVPEMLQMKKPSRDTKYRSKKVYKDFYRPQSKGDNVLGNVRPSVRLSVGQQRARKSHYQSRVFVCVSSNRTDAVDWLLILLYYKS